MPDRPNPLNLPEATLRRHEEQQKENMMILQAALLEAGVVEHESPDFHLDHLARERASAERPIAFTEYTGRMAALISAVDTVEASTTNQRGQREALALAVRQVIQGLEQIATILGSCARVMVAPTEERDADIRDSEHLLVGVNEETAAILERLRPRDLARALGVVDKRLTAARPRAVKHGFYGAKGKGPEAHFIFEAWDVGFTCEEIAEFRLFRKLRKAGQSELERRRLIEEETEKVRDRLDAYRKILLPRWREMSGELKSPPADWNYQAVSGHAGADSQLVVHSGSGEGLPGIDWHCASLDSHWAPCEPASGPPSCDPA